MEMREYLGVIMIRETPATRPLFDFRLHGNWRCLEHFFSFLVKYSPFLSSVLE